MYLCIKSVCTAQCLLLLVVCEAQLCSLTAYFNFVMIGLYLSNVEPKKQTDKRTPKILKWDRREEEPFPTKEKKILKSVETFSKIPKEAGNLS